MGIKTGVTIPNQVFSIQFIDLDSGGALLGCGGRTSERLGVIPPLQALSILKAFAGRAEDHPVCRCLQDAQALLFFVAESVCGHRLCQRRSGGS